MQEAVPPRDLALGAAASLLAGLVVGTIGTFKHQFGVSAVDGSGLPIGLALSLLMVLVFLVALRLSFPTRWYPAAAAAGIVGAIALLSLPGSSGGSTVILLNTAGIVWTVAPAVLAAVVVGWPRIARRRPVDQEAGGILEPDQGNRIDDTKDH